MFKRHLLIVLVVMQWILIAPTVAAEFDALVAKALQDANAPRQLIRTDIGVTARGTSIPCFISPDELDYNSNKTRILVVGGLDASAQSFEATMKAINSFYGSEWAKRLHQRYSIAAVPIADPDGWASGRPGVKTWCCYPPAGGYDSKSPSPEAVSVWRWIGVTAPDLVVVVRGGTNDARWLVPADGADSLKRLKAQLRSSQWHATKQDEQDLAIGLTRAPATMVGTVPAVVVHSADGGFIRELLAAIEQSRFAGPSDARREMQMRLDRSPIQVATQLSKHYGHNLSTVAYIPALALIGRLRLGQLTNDRSHLADVERIVAPYVKGEKPSIPKRMSGSILSGHLVFGELAQSSKAARTAGRTAAQRRYLELARAAADLGFNAEGQPLASMPNHNEMSDSVFMGCPILVQVGRLTGESKYFDMALRHLRFMLKLNLRQDGLHRHSPLDEAAWGRGNGFPALGLALSLTDWPSDHPGRAEVLAAFRIHIQSLARHQDPTGAWHQVVDHPGSYRELTSTCMITFAMIRGVRMGWLDSESYAPLIAKAWKAIRSRVAPDGTLVDVCTGTGKQKDLRAYLDRKAILGTDPRGGAMSLMVSTEMAAWHAERVRATNQP